MNLLLVSLFKACRGTLLPHYVRLYAETDALRGEPRAAVAEWARFPGLVCFCVCFTEVKLMKYLVI